MAAISDTHHIPPECDLRTNYTASTCVIPTGARFGPLIRIADKEQAEPKDLRLLFTASIHHEQRVPPVPRPWGPGIARTQTNELCIRV